MAGGTAGRDILGSAEIWDPVTGTFSLTGSMVERREKPTATLLVDGRVLIAGGLRGPGEDGVLASLEIWDPAGGSSAPAGSLTVARWRHTATSLPDGRVLVVGGMSAGSVSAAAEVWDPVTGQTASAGTLGAARSDHTATALPDGRVLIVGGLGHEDQPLPGAEVWEPSTGAFEETGLLEEARARHTATLLPDGRVLVTGGSRGPGDDAVVASAEVWHHTTDEFEFAGYLGEARTSHTATLLDDGRVLVAGGSSRGDELASTELWIPTSPDAAAGSTAPTLFDPGLRLVTVADGLRVRSLPSVSEGSVKYEPLLAEGTKLRVLYGPVAGSGYWWYRVRLSNGRLKDGVREGWVAAADHDGTPWLSGRRDAKPGQPVPPRTTSTSPAAPIRVRVTAFDPWERRGISCDPGPCAPVGLRLRWMDAPPAADQAGFRVYLVRYRARWEGNPYEWIERCQPSVALEHGRSEPRLIAELGPARTTYTFSRRDWHDFAGRPAAAAMADWRSTSYRYGWQLLVSAFDRAGRESRLVPGEPVEYFFCGLKDPTP